VAQKIEKTITSTGFYVNDEDKCVYYHFNGVKWSYYACISMIYLYLEQTHPLFNGAKSFLSRCFDMKDLRVADVILNIKLIENEDEITLNQSHYAEKLLSHFGFENNKMSPTPYDASVKLRKNKGSMRQQLKYSQIIGSLIYLASATQPDLSFALSKLSRFTSIPGGEHWEALKRVLCYLIGTISY
jgi:hypothetical protein